MLGLPFTWLDVVDILLFAFILFEVYRLLRRSGAKNLFWGIFAFVLSWVLLTNVLHLSITGALFDRVISVGAIALIVIFQEEIRNFFYRLGSRFSNHVLQRNTRHSVSTAQRTAMQIVRACQNMSKTQTGALIILASHQDLKSYADTGERIDAQVSARLIENIFFKNTPLHDGALIIQNHRLQAAGCILPVSKNPEIPLQYGLRHRAALGICEITNVTAIVVSEETGHISVAQNSQIKPIDNKELLDIVSAALE